jgi:arabinofuranan 3-O-arabinosyltransferase
VFKQPLTTDRLDVSFPRVQQAITVSSTGQRSTLPVELSRLSVPALAKLRPVAPRARLSVACGQGPALRIDGRAYRTAVSGTLGELSGYRPLQVRLCAPDGTLKLGAGRHT